MRVTFGEPRANLPVACPQHTDDPVPSKIIAKVLRCIQYDPVAPLVPSSGESRVRLGARELMRELHVSGDVT
eukprot:3164273-Pyramimonas_sp.AAC.1